MTIMPDSTPKRDAPTKGSITYYVALIVMLIMPIYHWYLPPFMVLWFIFWLFAIKQMVEDLKHISLNYKILFVLFILFYIWQLAGMLYSDNTEAGWRNIILRISLCLFPLVLLSPGELIRKRVNTLLWVFALCTLLFLFICLGYALYRSLNLQNGIWNFNPHPQDETWLNFFYGAEFAFLQHPSYLSMSVIFSFFISTESFYNRSLKKLFRFLWLAVSICLMVALYLLSSRAEILAAIIALPVYFIYKYRVKNIVKIGGLLILIVLFFLFILIPVFKSNARFSYYFTDDQNKQLSSIISKEGRVEIWKSSLHIVRHNFIFGVGTGDIQDELNKEYKKMSVNNEEIPNNLNAHNQYLEVLLENGFIGLMLFISIFGIMFYIAIKEANLIYLMFIIIVLISFTFETMLNRLAGVSFFALFSFLLLNAKPAAIPTSEVPAGKL
jgi:O-antigen ligase